VPSSSSSRFGLSAALTTPFRPDGGVDLPRFVGHARWCLQNGCDSVTAFGTTGEGTSIGMADREQVLGALAGAGCDMAREVVAGVSANSVEGAAAQARMALDLHCRALLVAPPFYFKNLAEDGLYAWFAGLIDALGDAARDIILYNIPQVTQVALPVTLVGRLKTAFPGIIIGVKDSSGDWPYTQALLADHGELAILIGDERFLAQGMRQGAQGTICGLANFCPQVIESVIESGRDDPRVVRMVDELLKYPVIPAIKALVAHRTRNDAWRTMRPPLVALDKADAARLGQVHDMILAVAAA
jgi:4-hydroxy-tetrahydrodipicolinate synthase